MDYSSTETVYKALVNLHDKLEETILKKSQMILKEILNAEKLALLTKIEHLLENEWTELNRLAKDEAIIQNGQTFRCQSCNKNFPNMKTSSDCQNKSNIEYGTEYFDTETETPHLYGSGDSREIEESVHDPFGVENDTGRKLYTPNISAVSISSSSNYRSISGSSGAGKRPTSVPTVSITPITIDDEEIQVIDVEEENMTEETTDPFVIQYFPMDIGGNNETSLQPPQGSKVTNVGATTISSTNTRPKRQLQQQRQQPKSRNDYKQPSKQPPAGRSQYGYGQGQQVDISAFKKYQCQYCSYTTDMKSHFIVHIRVHTGEKPYHCGICSKSFTQSSSLNLHLKKIHNASQM